MNNLCISIKTSNARISSGFSECRALDILEIHLIITLMYCLSWMLKSNEISDGIASLFNN